MCSIENHSDSSSNSNPKDSLKCENISDLIVIDGCSTQDHTNESDKVRNLCVSINDKLACTTTVVKSVLSNFCTTTENDTMIVGNANLISVPLPNSNCQEELPSHEWCDSISEVLNNYAADDSIFLESLAE